MIVMNQSLMAYAIASSCTSCWQLPISIEIMVWNSYILDYEYLALFIFELLQPYPKSSLSRSVYTVEMGVHY